MQHTANTVPLAYKYTHSVVNILYTSLWVKKNVRSVPTKKKETQKMNRACTLCQDIKICVLVACYQGVIACEYDSDIHNCNRCA